MVSVLPIWRFILLKSGRKIDRTTYFSGDGDKSKKKKKKDDSAASSEEGSDEERPRKRGRPRASGREAYKGFADAEVINMSAPS